MAKRSGYQFSNHEKTSTHTSPTDGTESAAQESPANQTRRSFLRASAVAGIASLGALTAASGSASAFHEGYDDVVNVVDAGADPTGSESITPVLEDVRADNTAFEFPEGEYYMDEQFRFTSYENIGFFGDDATIVPANFYDFHGPQYRLFRLGTYLNPGKRLRFEGFDIDQTADETGIRVIGTNVTDQFEVRDITIHGEHDSGTWGPALFGISDPNGEGVVERFRAPDGGLFGDYTPNAENTWKGPIGIEANMNQGTLEFIDCELDGFPSTGLYASSGDGKIVVEGGTYRNNGTASLRIGGRDSEIRDVTIEVDEEPSYELGQRGLRIENSDGVYVDNVDISITAPNPNNHAVSVMNTCNDLQLENCSIEMRGDRVNHGIVISEQAGEAWINNVDIVHETSGGYPIWIRNSDSDDRVLFERIDISGEAGVEGGFRDGIWCGRNNCRFSTFVVDQPGRGDVNRNGIMITGEDTEIYRGEFYASQYPYIDQGHNNHVRNSVMISDDDDLEGARLYSTATEPTLQYNEIENGIDDLGASSVSSWHNEP